MESAAFLAIKQDDQAAALSLSEESLRIGRRLGDHDLVAKALNVVGLVARQSGDMDQARACFGERKCTGSPGGTRLTCQGRMGCVSPPRTRSPL